MQNTIEEINGWKNKVIKEEDDAEYLRAGRDFIDGDELTRLLEERQNPDPQEIRAIISKSLSIESLELREAAALLNVTDPELWGEIFLAAARVKKKVYDNRVVTFAPFILFEPLFE